MSSRSLVFDLQMAINQAGFQSESAGPKMAREYATACENANARLINAVTNLRQGCRSEAMRLCEMEPNLLEEVNTLNFVQRPTWVQVAQRMNIRTPELMLDLAVEVIEAYDIHENTKELTAQLRWQAVKQVAVEDRVATLEALQQADPQNPVWEENLRQLRG